MSAAMPQADDRTPPWLPDEETWESPGRLTAAELYVHAGAGRAYGCGAVEDPEDER